MASGRLGKATLAAATQTLLYTVPALTVATINIRVTNRAATVSKVRVAITEGGVPSNDDYVTYDKTVEANGILEETGMLCSAGEQVYVYSDTANVSVRVHGFEEVA
jgi:hypothetical protein